MDRLNNITGRGQDGFPVSTEVISILHSYSTFIEAILGGLHLPQRSCVLLKYNEREGIFNASGLTDIIAFTVPYSEYVYPVDSFVPVGTGIICRINDISGFTSNELIGGSVQKSVQIVETDNDVVSNVNGENGAGEGEKVWQNVYTTVIADLIAPSVANPAYNFYRLKDIIKITL